MRRDTNMRVGSSTKMHPDASRKEAIRAFYAMREELARAEAERDELKAQLAAIGNGWEAVDGVEFPIGRVEVLIVRPAIWRDDIEEWEDTRTDKYLTGVIAYREAPSPTEAAP